MRKERREGRTCIKNAESENGTELGCLWLMLVADDLEESFSRHLHLGVRFFRDLAENEGESNESALANEVRRVLGQALEEL